MAHPEFLLLLLRLLVRVVHLPELGLVRLLVARGRVADEPQLAVRGELELVAPELNPVKGGRDDMAGRETRERARDDVLAGVHGHRLHVFLPVEHALAVRALAALHHLPRVVDACAGGGGRG